MNRINKMSIFTVVESKVVKYSLDDTYFMKLYSQVGFYGVSFYLDKYMHRIVKFSTNEIQLEFRK